MKSVEILVQITMRLPSPYEQVQEATHPLSQSKGLEEFHKINPN